MPNSSGTFLSANEDPTETLAEIEKKIARATMLPRNHGEVLHNISSYIPYLWFNCSSLVRELISSRNLHVSLSLFFIPSPFLTLFHF